MKFYLLGPKRHSYPTNNVDGYYWWAGAADGPDPRSRDFWKFCWGPTPGRAAAALIHWVNMNGDEYEWLK